mgnify:CR=1 FL=1
MATIPDAKTTNRDMKLYSVTCGGFNSIIQAPNIYESDFMVYATCKFDAIKLVKQKIKMNGDMKYFFRVMEAKL